MEGREVGRLCTLSLGEGVVRVEFHLRKFLLRVYFRHFGALEATKRLGDPPEGDSKAKRSSVEVRVQTGSVSRSHVKDDDAATH